MFYFCYLKILYCVLLKTPKKKEFKKYNYDFFFPLNFEMSAD